MVNDIRSLALMMDRLPLVERSPDPHDDYLLALAQAGGADILVTGDKRDLLSLQLHEGTRIMTARDAVALGQLGFHLAKRDQHLLADHIRAHVIRPNLHNARLLAFRGGQDGAEVEVVRQHNEVVGLRVGHDHRVRRILRADR